MTFLTRFVLCVIVSRDTKCEKASFLVLVSVCLCKTLSLNGFPQQRGGDLLWDSDKADQMPELLQMTMLIRANSTHIRPSFILIPDQQTQFRNNPVLVITENPDCLVMEGVLNTPGVLPSLNTPDSAIEGLYN